MATSCFIPDCDHPQHALGFCKNHYGAYKRHLKGRRQGARYGEGLAWIERHLDYKGGECLVWPFGKLSKKKGYGGVHVDGQMWPAHRYMAFRAFGPPPAAWYHAAHICNNGECVNPRHLVWKTPSGNMQDKLSAGTHNRGERSPLSKLTESQVRDIRRRLRLGETCRALATELGVSKSTVHLIGNGKLWGWLTE